MVEQPIIPLASGSSDLVGLLAFLVIAAISAIYNWLTNQKKKEEAEARQREALERRRRELAAQQSEEQGKDQAPVLWPKPTTTTPTTQPRTETPRLVRRSPYAKQATPVKPQPVVARAQQVADADRLRVDEELRRQQQRLEQEELERQRRLSEYRPPESDEEAIASRLVHVQPATVAPTAAAGQERAALHVDLRTPAAARQAILFSEILGRPKALRHGDELWDA